MKKALRRSLSLLLAITLVFGSAYVGLSECDFSGVSLNGLFTVKAKAVTSGITGDCMWSLDGTVLTISGDGKMGDYDSMFMTGIYYNYAPWADSRNNIRTIIIDDGVTNVGDGVFTTCTSLVSVSIPDSVTTIGKYAFADCSGLVFVSLPDSITTIGDNAFRDCKSLVSMSIPDSVSSIGVSAFESCASLTSVSIPNSLTEISVATFRGCTSLLSVVIPNSVNTIGNSAFNYCYNLQTIEIPDSVTNIGSHVFANCGKLEFIDLPDNISSISYSTFYNSGLKSVKIPDGVTEIGSEAFMDCYRLESLEIPGSVTTIGTRAFASTGIIELHIPESVTSIDSESFSGCSSIVEITVDANNPAYSSKDGVLFNKTQETLIKYNSGNEREKYIVPDSVTYINANSFGWCYNLKTIVLNKQMTNVNGSVFCSVSLNSVVIPVEVVSIGKDAFGAGSTEVYYEGTEEQWNNILIAANNNKLTDGRLHYRVDIFDWENHYGAPVTTQPTCTQNGNNKYTCPCGYEKTEVIPYTGHNYSAEWTIDVAPTCTTSGSKSQHCTKCTAKRNVTYISSTGHTSSDWIIDNDNMLKYKECTVCKTVLASESIYAIPATPKVTTSNEIGGVKVNWNAVEGAVKYNVYRRQGGSSAWVYAGTTTGTTLLDTSVNSGVYYIYSVRAYNYVGQYSAFVSANTSTRKYMAVPKLVSISNAINGLHIKWDAVDGVTNGYRVYRRGAGSSYWTYLGTVKTTSYTDTAVKDNGGEYFRYTVIADGGYHSKFDITGLYLRRIGTPVLKSATSIAVGNIVRWGTVKGCNEYYVYRKTSNSNWVRIGAIDGANSSAFVDTTAKKGTTYTYTVKAVYGKTMSAYNSGVNCYTKY